MIYTLQHNWNVLTSIYNSSPACVQVVTKMQIFIGNSKDAQVAVQHICISHASLLLFKYAH